MTQPTSSPVSVLFVCLGNICRSTMAEGVFRHLTHSNSSIGTVDSCGTAAYYHTDNPPDERTMSVLEEKGITDYTHRARTIESSDFTNFDYILVMDKYNLADVRKLQRQQASRKGSAEKTGQVMLFGDFGGNKGEEVIDPYYGGRDGFLTAYEQIVRFSRGFLHQALGQDADVKAS